jgi:hypothetical protein
MPGIPKRLGENLMKLATGAAGFSVSVGRKLPQVPQAMQVLKRFCSRRPNCAAAGTRFQSRPTIGKGLHGPSCDLVVHDRPLFDQRHPKVYATAIGLVIWFAAAWILFDHSFGGPREVSLPLAMVSVLLLIAVRLPLALSLVWKRHRMPGLRARSHGDFAVWGGKIRAMHAAIVMLLPLAGVAFGLTASESCF